MSALGLLIGGALFLTTAHFAGQGAVIVLALALGAIELHHDLGLYRRERSHG